MSPGLETSRVGASTAYQANLFHCLITMFLVCPLFSLPPSWLQSLLRTGILQWGLSGSFSSPCWSSPAPSAYNHRKRCSSPLNIFMNVFWACYNTSYLSCAGGHRSGCKTLDKTLQWQVELNSHLFWMQNGTLHLTCLTVPAAHPVLALLQLSCSGPDLFNIYSDDWMRG